MEMVSSGRGNPLLVDRHLRARSGVTPLLREVYISSRIFPPHAAAWLHLALVSMLAACGMAVSGCAQTDAANLSNRTFYREEYGLDTHGRKTWFDHLLEADPGSIRVVSSPDYEQEAPAKIAVLPFADRGSAQFVVDKIALTRRTPEEEADWAWTDANRLRRAIDGYLSEREFLVENMIQVDRVMKNHHIYNEDALKSVPPQTLGRWLGVDAVIYGEVTHYEAYYVALVAVWRVGVDIRMVSTHDGRQLFAENGSRYSVDANPAFDPVDILMNSGLTLFGLRDVMLARAEDETAREMVLRIPRSPRLEGDLIEQVDSWFDSGGPGEAGSEQSAIIVPSSASITPFREQIDSKGPFDDEGQGTGMCGFSPAGLDGTTTTMKLTPFP